MDISRVYEITQVLLKMRAYFEGIGCVSYALKVVPSNYYEQTLEWRAQQLGAPSTQYLCKSILMENTAHDESYESNPKYIQLIIQYVTKINAEKVMKWVRNFQNSREERKANKTKFHFRLMADNVSREISGYEHNAVTPFLMKQYGIPLIISQNIKKLNGFIWLGGGDVDIKLRVSLADMEKIFAGQIYYGDIVYD